MIQILQTIFHAKKPPNCMSWRNLKEVGNPPHIYRSIGSLQPSLGCSFRPSLNVPCVRNNIPVTFTGILSGIKILCHRLNTSKTHSNTVNQEPPLNQTLTLFLSQKNVADISRYIMPLKIGQDGKAGIIMQICSQYITFHY